MRRKLKAAVRRGLLALGTWALRKAGSGEPHQVRGCYIQKRAAGDRLFIGPDRHGLMMVDLDRYAVIPLETIRNPLRRAAVIFDLVCPGHVADVRNQTPQQAYYQALIDGAALESKAIAALEGRLPQRLRVPELGGAGLARRG